MKPSLEVLKFPSSQKSYNFFKVDVPCFVPYWHYHPEVELTFITKGQGTRFVGNSILPFYDYDLVLVGENVPHHWVSLKREDDVMQQAYVFQFPKDIFGNIVECAAFGALFQEAQRGIHFRSPSTAVIEKIIGFDALNPVQQVGALMGLLSKLLADDNRVGLSSKIYKLNAVNSLQNFKVKETISYILENLDKKLTVNMLAERTHMVPQSFCRWFKSSVGNSFVTFLNAARIERACQLLTTTETPIKQIAYQSGFESLSHFNRTFKHLKGESPRDLRYNFMPTSGFY